MKAIRRVVFVLSALVAPVLANIYPSEPPPRLTSLDGYPGVLSRDYVQATVENELRQKVHNMYSRGHNKTETPRKRPRRLKDSGSSDLTGLNDYLGQIEFDIPEQNLQTEVLGTTATVNVIGKCGDFFIESLGLTYETGGDSLTYNVAVQNVDVKCQLLVDWNLGVLDVEDKLQIRIVLNDNDFNLGVTLSGSPPTSSTFQGCDAVINIKSISSSGGFSANILNELEDLILEIVHVEAQAISDIVCDLVGGFTDAVDGVLATLDETLAPYLVKVAKVDPLRLEQEVEVEKKLVDLKDSTLGEVLQVFITNLQGVIGAFQINKLIELNLLDENGLFVQDLSGGGARRLQATPAPGDEGAETCSFLRRRLVRNLEDTLVQEVGLPLERHIRESLDRHLQATEAPQPIFNVNEVALQSLAVDGLNTFKDSRLLEIIGKQTLRSRLAIKGVSIVVTVLLDVNINDTQIKETITATLSVDGISAVISFFAGLDDEVINGLRLANFLDTDNIFDCLLSSVVALGISELSVSVGSIGTPVVSGAIAPGVDDFLNTAVEAAFVTYQDLLYLAVPALFQNNVTVIANDFLDCYVRVNSQGSCPEVSLQEAVANFGGGGDGGGDEGAAGGGATGDSVQGDVTFSFRDENGGSTTQFNGANVDGTSSSSKPQESSSGAFQGYLASNAQSTSSIGNSTLKSGSFISTDASYIQSAAASPTVDGFVKGFIDFRDLLLPPDAARSLGGSGNQPYGNLVSMGFQMMRDQMASLDNITGLPAINTEVLKPITEGQSGVNGMLRFPETFFNTTIDTLAMKFLRSVLTSIEISASDARIGNVNTLVSPVKFLEPTKRAHVLENILNFGPVLGRPLNMSFSLRTNFERDALSSPGWNNEIDISASAAALDVNADFRVMIAAKEFLQFPIKDMLNVNCWLAMIQAPNMDVHDIDTIDNALAVKSFLMKVVSTTLDFKCVDCMSKLLPTALDVLREVGATKLLGKRMGSLLEEIVTVDTVPVLLTEFLRLGEEAARLCPHSPTFNTTSSNENETLSLDIPPLSNHALDTIIFAGLLGSEVMAVSFAESYLNKEQEDSESLNTDIELNAAFIPSDGRLLDWTDLNNTKIPFIGDALHFVQNSLGKVTMTDTGSQNLGINEFMRGVGGMFAISLGDLGFNSSGIQVTAQSIQLQGLDSFSKFDVLQPLSRDMLENSLILDNLTIGLNLSVDVLETSEPPMEVSISFQLKDVNVSMPLLAAIDEERLSAVKLGTLLYSSNILPCLLETTYDLRVKQMLVSVGDINEPLIEGLQPDTGKAASDSLEAILHDFSRTIKAAIPMIFDDTLRTMINDFIADEQKKECKEQSSLPESRYLDFREMFQPSNASTSLYGDLMPTLKAMLESELLSNNPDTHMPKINDVLIAPFTEAQSGVRGTLALPTEIFGFDFAGLAELGIENLGIGLSDARIENLDSIGPPLQILEPNSTNGILLDNRATFGTEYNPFRFAIKSTMTLSGPLLNTSDEMNIFGELREAPFFAVLLARVGTKEFLSFPLRYADDMDCWLATIAAPALQEIAAGKTEMDPVLALKYLGIAVSSVRVSASCSNCTTPGFIRLPELLEIGEASGAKDVLGQRTINIVMDMLTSDFTQVWILKILQDSMRKCALTTNSTVNSVAIADAALPAISADWIESGMFATTVFAQLGIVILAETISVVHSDVGPIFKEPEPDIPPGTRLVDFTALDTYPVGSLARQFIEGANSFLGDASTDPETGETTLGINELLGENPLRDLGTFSQKFDDYDFDISGLRIKLQEVKISGLDSFTKFQILDITGPTQLNNELSWKSLHLEIFMEIDVPASTGLQHSSMADEKLAVSVEFEAVDIKSSLELMLALDYELLKNLELGSLLRFAHILPCIQASVRHLEISKMNLDIGRVTKMRLNGFKSSDTSEAAESLERLLLEKYGDVLAGAAPSLFSVALRPLINTAITTYIRDSDFKCDEFPFESDGTGFIDFRDMFLSPTQSKRFGGSGRGQYGDLVRSAFGIIRLQLMTAHPEDGIQLLTPLIGSLSFPGVLLNQGIKFNIRDLQADVSLRLSDLHLNNLDSLGKPLSFLEPIHGEAHQLNNSATLGIGNRPVEVGGRVYMHVKGTGGLEIINDFDLTLDIHVATAVLTVLLKVSEEAFVRFPLRDMLNLNCWLAMIPPPPLDNHGVRIEGAPANAALTDLDMTAKELGLQLYCHNCTSKALLELSDLLASPESSEDMTKVVNNVFQSITRNLKGGFVQDQINRLLVEAPNQCGHTDEFDPKATPVTYEMFETSNASSTSSYITMLVVILIPILLMIAMAFCVKRSMLQRHKKWMLGLPSERVFLIHQKQERSDHREAELNELTSSMYKSQDIPLFVRQLIPIVVVANIGFFLSGHLNKGGRVLIDLAFAGESFQIDDFYTFSIGQSALDMWHNGGKELAVLILLFSGVWPYTKQLITLALWFLPPSVVSCTRRGQFLNWLDILAKWSMIDIMVMLITIVGFRVQIRSPNFAFLPKDFYSIDILVVPMWGLWSNLIAQLISQLSSHFIVHYHRKVTRKATMIYEERHGLQAVSNLTTEDALTGGLLPSARQEAKKEKLYQYAFSRLYRGAPDTVTVRQYINKLLLTGSIILCILLITSCSIPSLNLETFGVIGLLMKFGETSEEASRHQNVLSMANALVEQAKYLGGFSNHIGMGLLAFLFVLTVLVVPIMQISTLMFQWFFPLTLQRRAVVATILEHLQAWQYIEVFIIALLVESWQLGSISKLLLNHFCTGLDFTFNLLVYYGVMDENDGQCFAIEASVDAGAYLMVPTVVGLAVINAFVVKAYAQYLRERREAEEVVSEDEMLRAHDRTHWDSREAALEQIKVPKVQFTDAFSWLLYREDVGVDKAQPCPDDGTKMLDAGTFSLADTSNSDEEHGSSFPPITGTISSITNESSTRNSGDDLGLIVSSPEQQATSDCTSVTSGSHNQASLED